MLESRGGAAVDGWPSSDPPSDLQEACSNTKRASGAPRKAAAAAAGNGPSGVKKGGKKATGSLSSSRRSSSSAAGKRRLSKSGGKAKGRKSNGGGGAASTTAASSVRSSRASTAGGSKTRAKAGPGSGAKNTAKNNSKNNNKTNAKHNKTKRSSSAGGGKKRRQLSLAVALSHLQEEAAAQRRALVAEEELERGGYDPLYNVLVMELVRVQVQQLNQRQQLLNETFAALRAEGFSIGGGDGENESGGSGVDGVLERLRAKLRSEAVEEAQRLREENTSLRERLADRGLEVDRRVSELEVLRAGMARRLARAEMESEHLTAETRAALQSATLDVARMQKALAHRLDSATAALRTPAYGTALRSLHDLAAEAQREIQAHHDRLAKLIAGLSARDTFRPDAPETMHSNFPAAYRAQLRALAPDHLLNILDILSFQEGVVEAVGKALYVLAEAAHKTAVV